MSYTDGAAGGARAALIQFQIAPAGMLPPGQTCKLAESDGRLDAYLGQGHVSGALCGELTHLHRALTEQGRWVQTPVGDARDRIEQPPEGLCVACVRWERVAAEVLPKGMLAAMAERDGGLTVLLHEGHASTQLCADMSAHAERIVGDGLWRQRWPA